MSHYQIDSPWARIEEFGLQRVALVPDVSELAQGAPPEWTTMGEMGEGEFNWHVPYDASSDVGCRFGALTPEQLREALEEVRPDIMTSPVNPGCIPFYASAARRKAS